MWRSKVIAARSVRSAHTKATRGLSHSKSCFPQLHSQVHKPQTLASYRHLENFRSNTIRFFSSSSTDSITDVEASTGNNADVIGNENENENENNDSFSIGEIWKDGIDEANSVLEMDASDSENKESVEAVHEAQEVDIDELQRVISLLMIRDGDSDTISVSLRSKLNDMNLNLSEEFVVRVLETPHLPVENLIAFFKWVAADKSEAVFSVTTSSLDALVRAVCKELKKKVAYSLWDLVKELGVKENSVVTTEMLNSLISLFSRLGKGMAGYEVFNKFEELSCETNADSYYYTIEALCRRSIFDRVGLVCQKMLTENKLPEAVKVGSIICYLCKAGMVKEAHSVYLSAKEKQKNPPQSSLNFLISSLCDRKKVDSDSVHLALKMLEDFKGDQQKHAIKQFSCVIQGLCRVNDFEGAKNLLTKMIDEGPPPGNAVFNTIINGLSKSGNMKEAIETMRVMENRGLKPDVFAYSVIMSGYAKGGEMGEAVKMLTEAKKNHCKLTPVTYHTMIRGYCKLEQFGKAVKLLHEMESYGVKPNNDEYNKLIQTVCLKAADWRMAEKLMVEMERKGLCLNGITKSLVRAVKELEEDAKVKGTETEKVSVES